jgi:hypothetical protein
VDKIREDDRGEIAGLLRLAKAPEVYLKAIHRIGEKKPDHIRPIKVITTSQDQRDAVISAVRGAPILKTGFSFTQTVTLQSSKPNPLVYVMGNKTVC